MAYCFFGIAWKSVNIVYKVP